MVSLRLALVTGVDTVADICRNKTLALLGTVSKADLAAFSFNRVAS